MARKKAAEIVEENAALKNPTQRGSRINYRVLKLFKERHEARFLLAALEADERKSAENCLGTYFAPPFLG
ncbi:hypothetical protein [Tardisphaera saccharovorans]